MCENMVFHLVSFFLKFFKIKSSPEVKNLALTSREHPSAITAEVNFFHSFFNLFNEALSFCSVVFKWYRKWCSASV